MNGSVGAAQNGGPVSLSIGGLLAQAYAERPDNDFVVFGTERLSVREAHERASRFARALVASGVTSGDHVGVLMNDDAEYVVVLLAVAMVGAVLVPVSTRYKSSELPFALEHADIDLLLVADNGTDFSGRLTEVFPELSQVRPDRLQLTGLPRLRAVVLLDGSTTAPAGVMAGADFLMAAEQIDDSVVGRLGAVVQPDDIAMIMYTSGTTGRPKGCMLRHEALVRNAANLARRFAMTEQDRVWAAGTFFHLMGVQPLLSCLWSGAAFVGTTFWDPETILRTLESEHCTVAIPVRDNDWMAVLTHPTCVPERLRSLRMTYCVGLEENVRITQARLPWAPQVGAWGCTEATGMMSLAAPDDSEEVRLTSGGKPFEGNSLSVTDDRGVPLPPGQVGQVVYTGYCIFAGYYKDPQHTAEVIQPDGRFRPGDLAWLDADGRPHFAGTLKGMIRVGGENVSYLEVENFVCTHPAVRFACVVGVRDSRYGEVPAAFVELEPGASTTEQEIIEFSLGKLASFKIPRYVRIVEQWPMSATKVARPPLKDGLERELDAAGISEAPHVREYAPRATL